MAALRCWKIGLKVRFAALGVCFSGGLLVPAIAMATSCVPIESEGYDFRNGEIHYYFGSSEEKRAIVRKAHKRTFEVISYPPLGGGPCSSSAFKYAKDHRRVYYRGREILGADPATWTLIDRYYARDKSGYFGLGQRIEGVGFEVLPYDYVRTSAAVFHYGRPVKVDVATFEVINPSVSMTRDKNRVYYRDVAIPKADPSTITQIKGYLFKDKRAVYSEGREIVGLSPHVARTFPLGGEYTADDKSVYRRYAKIDRDPATFEVLQPWYTRDKNGVYFKEIAIESADVESFVSTSLSRARDKNYQYYENRVECRLNPSAPATVPQC